MLIQQTLEGLRHLKLVAMATAFERLQSSPMLAQQGPHEIVAMLVEAERNARETRRMQRLHKLARFRTHACPEDISYETSRNLDRAVVSQLLTCQWVRHHLNVVITGATGTGKTWLACALGVQAIRLNLPVLYRKSGELIEEFSLARKLRTLPKLRGQLLRARVLILDDFLDSAMSDEGRQDLCDLIKAREKVASTLIVSQLPFGDWHGAFGEPTLADAVLDRLHHASHFIELKGDSLRVKDGAARMRAAATTEE